MTEPFCQYSCSETMEVSSNLFHIPHVAWNTQRACIFRSYQLQIESIFLRVCNLKASPSSSYGCFDDPSLHFTPVWENVKVNTGSRCDCWHWFLTHHLCLSNSTALQSVEEVTRQLQDLSKISVSCLEILVSHLSYNWMHGSQWSAHEESRVPQRWLQLPWHVCRKSQWFCCFRSSIYFLKVRCTEGAYYHY